SLTKPNEGPWLKAPLSDNLINILKEASAKRQAELPEFSTLNHSIEWTRSRTNRKEVSISLEQRRQERTDDLTFREQVRGELNQFTKNSFKAKDVKLDAALDQEKKEGAEYTSKSKRQSRIREPLEDEDWPDYDIQLQEAIRIADDWSKLLADKNSQAGAPAKTAELVR
ncbi:MAG: hypothetical protein EBQ49_02805, partial [Verrucomicrobia bacterium]|nr:hypothetical protein [Verrucomicrobiota bacterium]